MPEQIKWHRLAGLVLQPLFDQLGCETQIEVDLSLKEQRVDIIVVQREKGKVDLGAHTEYNAELLDVFTFNHSAIAIRYKNYAKGVHPQNNQPIEYSQVMMEVLEIENGKIAVIRKYHE